MSVSRRVRFEVFKRDGFTCQYCGGTPPKTLLEVDHISPRNPRDGSGVPGTDDEANLVTSCQDCNRGKSNVPLSSIPQPLSDRSKELQEKQEQLRAYEKLVVSKERKMQRDIDKINDIYSEAFPGWEFSSRFKQGSIRTFLSRLPRPSIEECLRIAIARGLDDKRTIPYFCGVCWKRIKGMDNADPA